MVDQEEQDHQIQFQEHLHFMPEVEGVEHIMLLQELEELEEEELQVMEQLILEEVQVEKT
jgi:hypothetical protein